MSKDKDSKPGKSQSSRKATPVSEAVAAADAAIPASRPAAPDAPPVETGPIPAVATVEGDAFDRLVGGSHHDPHGLLGAHPTADGRTVIRTLRPEASKVTAIIEGKPFELERLHDGGVFGAVVDGLPTDYRLEVTYGDETYTVDDPYRWLPTVGEVDLHLIGEGRHEQLWDVLGAHVRTYDTPQGPVSGTSFQVRADISSSRFM